MNKKMKIQIQMMKTTQSKHYSMRPRNSTHNTRASETTSTFTTPVKKSTKSVLELLRQATQRRLQLPNTFDVATAFLNESQDFVLKKESDDIAFLIGPRKDGII